MNVAEYLDTKNIPYKRTGNELIITCPGCGREKLYINAVNQAYHCFKCEIESTDSIYASGHFSQLMEEWGDIIQISPVKIRSSLTEKDPDFSSLVERYHFELKENRDALKYLYYRGINDESIDRFKLGYTRRYNQNWIVLPSFEDNIPKLLKLRKLPPDENTELDKCIREPNGKTILFNGDILKEYDEIFLAEGEIDAITLVQNGYENTVGLTGGAKTFPSDWYDLLFKKSKFYLSLDQDAAGQMAARDVWAARLGTDRCFNIQYPDGHDANSFFLEFDKETFDKLLAHAHKFKVDGIFSLKEVLYDMYKRSLNEDNLEIIPTPWKTLNKLIGGGVSKQKLIIIGGIPAVGKTSFCLQTCFDLVKNYSMPSLYFCLEMPEWSLGTKIIQMHKDLRIEEIQFSDALIYAMEFGDMPLYFGYAPKLTPIIFYNTVEQARNRFGIETVAFDNLQLLVRSDKESDYGKATQMFREMSIALNLIVFLISQPRKMNSEENPTYDVLKGTSAIAADADYVILLHRKRDTEGGQSFDPMTTVIVDKARFNTGGRCNLYFEGAKSKFIEIGDMV